MFYFENRENETIVNEMEFRVNEDEELILVKISKMSLSFFYRKRKRIFFVIR